MPDNSPRARGLTSCNVPVRVRGQKKPRVQVDGARLNFDNWLKKCKDTGKWLPSEATKGEDYIEGDVTVYAAQALYAAYLKHCGDSSSLSYVYFRNLLVQNGAEHAYTLTHYKRNKHVVVRRFSMYYVYFHEGG